MRLQALHVRGLPAPPGSLGLSIHKAYTLVTGSEPWLGILRDSLMALLCPARTLETLASLAQRHEGGPTSVVLTFRVGPQTYRAAADLDRARLALARHDPETDRFMRVATEPSEIERQLRELGRPDPEILARLCTISLDVGGPDGTHEEPGEEPAAADGPLAPELRVDSQPEIEVRTEPGGASSRRELAARVVELEREEKRLVEQLEPHAPLLERGEELEAQLERHRALREEADRGLASVDRMRRDLLEEHGRLTGVPVAQRPWLWLGSALTLAGGLAAYFFDPFVGILGAIGVGTVLLAASTSARARKRLGQLEARLAALRVREGTLAGRLTTELPALGELVSALGLSKVDDLEGTVAKVREMAARLEEVRRMLEDARRELPEPTEDAGSADDLLDDEDDDTAATLFEDITEEAEGLAGPSDGLEGGERVDLLVDAVSRWTERGAEHIWSEIQASLPLYLHALSRARVGAHPSRAPFRDLTSPGSLRELSPPERAFAELAIHLALFERLATTRRMLLLVGPDRDGSGEGDPTPIARLLARLAQVAQVIHFAPAAEPWTRFADQLQRLEG